MGRPAVVVPKLMAADDKHRLTAARRDRQQKIIATHGNATMTEQRAQRSCRFCLETQAANWVRAMDQKKPVFRCQYLMQMASVYKKNSTSKPSFKSSQLGKKCQQYYVSTPNYVLESCALPIVTVLKVRRA